MFVLPCRIDTCLRKGLPCSGKAKSMYRDFLLWWNFCPLSSFREWENNPLRLWSFDWQAWICQNDHTCNFCNFTDYHIFINSGGSKETVDNNEYEADTSPQGPSTYFLSESGKWAYSSMGDLMSSDSDLGYIAQNTSRLTMPNPKLYMTARSSPLSLKYYGLCLQNGNYTIKLHFAEIIFTDDQTYFSVGRRAFDVSIQVIWVRYTWNVHKNANFHVVPFVQISTIPL